MMLLAIMVASKMMAMHVNGAEQCRMAMVVTVAM